MHVGVKSKKPLQFVFLGMNPWNYSTLNDTVRCLIQAMDQDNLVYINPQAETRTGSVHWEEKTEGAISIWNPPFNFLPTRYGMHRLREKLSAQSLCRFIQQKFDKDWRENVVFYITASTLELSYEYVKVLKPKRMIFDILDDNLEFPGISRKKKKRLTYMFNDIAKQATVITAVSKYLVDKTKQLTGKSVQYLPNGVDVERFKCTDRHVDPTDLANIPHPRLTFVGAVTSWIDLELLEKTAQKLQSSNLVIVGPVFEKKLTLDRLKKMDNVYFLGEKPFEEIPRYMHASDVLLLPRTYDPHSLACDPLKLYEYLATGKPIVSTAHPSTERFSDFVTIGNDHDSFIDGIRMVLQCNRSYRVESIVDTLSWKARVDKMLQFLYDECCYFKC
jgi:glycosyltransferase involved in cell wall biosynthesis